MNSKQPLTVKCPTCKKPVRWVKEETFKPFCSHRCKLIDLSEWATENHKIPGDSAFTTLDNPDETSLH